MDALVREVQVLTDPRIRDSPEIIDLLQLVWEYEHQVLRSVLVFEFANCGTLTEFIQSGPAQSLSIKLLLCFDVLKGLSVLHEAGVVHGDVKCDNVVVFQGKNGSFSAKLIDFGFSIFLAELEPGTPISQSGTMPFIAPEWIVPIERDGLVYTDYFSCGMLVWQMLSDGKQDSLFSQQPFECPQKEASKEACRREIDENLWVYYNSILDSTLDPIPTQRNIGHVLALFGHEQRCVPNLTTSVATPVPDLEAAASETQSAMAKREFNNALDERRSPQFLDLRQFRTPAPALHIQIVASLERISEREGDERAADASSTLAQCHINGFGTEQSDDDGLDSLSEAGSRGHRIASFILPQIRAAIHPEQDREDVSSSEFFRLVELPRADSYPLNLSDTPDQILQLISENDELRRNLTWRQDSILHWAATFDLDEHLSRFLDAFPDMINAQNVVGETPLICAARHGNINSVMILVGSGADENQISFTGETALHWLVSFPDDIVTGLGHLFYNPLSSVSYALASESTPDVAAAGLGIVLGTPLHRAVALRRKKIVEFLLERKADCFFPGLSMHNVVALEGAGVAGKYQFPDANDMALLPIHIACRAHDNEMIELLLRHGSLQLPTWTGEKGQPRGFFLGFRMDRDDGLGCTNLRSRSLLGYACDPISRFSQMAMHGSRQKQALRRTFELLLSMQGQDLAKVAFTGMSALLAACESDDTELVLHILSLPGSSSILEQSCLGGWGMKPLHVATSHHNIVLVKALLDAGADALAERSSGETAMHMCAGSLSPDEDIARLLLSRAPELASMESYWETPFATAVRNHDFNCASLLLEYGADPNQLFGPHAPTTTLFQVLSQDEELDAVQFLLRLPNISSLVAPRKKWTALHAPFAACFRYDYYGESKPVGRVRIIKELLTKWDSKSDLEAREIKGYTPLHFACLSRDVKATNVILEAMERVGADVNAMGDYFGSPIWKTPLDLVEVGSAVPSEVTARGLVAVDRYNETTNELRRLVVDAGGKSQIATLNDKWSGLSFVERLKATLLINRVTRFFAVLGGRLHVFWLVGFDDVKARLRLWTQSNPDEVYYRRS
ncbi:ankyrin repeat-containing domain protein [Dactylonectria macrodidyma]|uniref:Ankyrin repeat-containing domain protein n=1 Tax=Dactylonectria macrodidyma TaxID=307937 RepID=A0A9P9EWD2_9HYPO|nr:ankyrin repeat-containing domain protein [Dactylonectria macrodidyma]